MFVFRSSLSYFQTSSAFLHPQAVPSNIYHNEALGLGVNNITMSKDKVRVILVDYL
jgi:hypothetical protein